MSIPIHPRIQLWLDLSGALAEAAEAAARQIRTQLRPRRRGAFLVRRPGIESPLWNAFVPLLRTALKPYGSKARLARYLGIPRQRLNDYLNGRTRLPDAELTLRMLHWLAEIRGGRNPAL
jgi:transcriptional regulator with XRE-family HTH domain